MRLMAGDWIKWVKGLASRREVVAVARSLSLSRHEVASRWMVLMEWTDENATEENRVGDTDDALVKSLTPEIVDDLVGTQGFARSMVSVGWLRLRNDAVEFVNYFRHNDATAKERALTKNRVEAKRGRGADSCNARSVTREEKIREKTKNPPNPPAGGAVLPSALDVPEFRAAWDEYVGYRSEQGLRRLKDKACGAMWKRMASWGVPKAIYAIKNTMSAGWTGVFEPKGDVPKELPIRAPSAPTLPDSEAAKFRRWWNDLPTEDRDRWAAKWGTTAGAVQVAAANLKVRAEWTTGGAA